MGKKKGRCVILTLKGFYETTEYDNTKNHPDGVIKCESCGKVLVGDFTSLPDYEVAFCDLSTGTNYECFENFVNDKIADYQDRVYDQMREEKRNGKDL